MIKRVDNEVEAEAADESDRSAVKSLRKALGVLGTIAAADRPLSVAEVAVRCGIARTTAHRLVQTLAAEGYVAQSALDGLLSVGLATLPLASSALDRNRMRLEALPHLQDLAARTGERTNLGVLHRQQVLYLAGVEKPSLPTIYTRFGKLVPAHCSALGKAILAHLPEADLRALLAARPLVASTETTITDPELFGAEIEGIRRSGYAVDRAEHVAGSYCVAAPIFDRNFGPVGAIGVSSRSLERVTAAVDQTLQKAELISHLL